MMEPSFSDILPRFIAQPQTGDLRQSYCPKTWDGLNVKMSFGVFTPARVPWIAFTAPGMKVSRGFYPVYLHYKDRKTLILSYGMSETKVSQYSWPHEVISSTRTIHQFFNESVPRYGACLVFRAYRVDTNGGEVVFTRADNGQVVSLTDLDSELSTILQYYKAVIAGDVRGEPPP